MHVVKLAIASVAVYYERHKAQSVLSSIKIKLEEPVEQLGLVLVMKNM